MNTQRLFTALVILFFTNIYAQVEMTKVKESTDAFSKQYADVGTIILVEKQVELINYATGFSNKEKGKKAKTKNLFEIGSASKMFTAIAVLQLVEKGKLSLNTPINKFFPDGKIKNLANFKGKNYWDKVTVEMLLNHTSGFIDYLNVYGDDEKALKIFSVKGKVYVSEELIDLAIAHGDANFIPGEKFKYCNTGYIILGDIISKLSGMNWRDYIQKNIFDKVGMKNTYFGSRLTKKANAGSENIDFNLVSSCCFRTFFDRSSSKKNGRRSVNVLETASCKESFIKLLQLSSVIFFSLYP